MALDRAFINMATEAANMGADTVSALLCDNTKLSANVVLIVAPPLHTKPRIVRDSATFQVKTSQSDNGVVILTGNAED